MSDTRQVSRRDFLQGSSAAAGTTLARLSWPAALAAAQAAHAAKEEAAGWSTLSNDEAREIEAFSARIIPTTSTPGAREAGVIYFFDNVLGDQMSPMLDGIRGSLAGFQAGIAERFPGNERFSDLDDADQDTWIAANEDSPFFGMARMLTIMGFFAMNKYGGNKDHIAWDLIGFDGHAPAQPPYGYYDAEYMEAQRHGN